MAGVKSRIGWHRRSTPAFSQTRAKKLYARLSVLLLEKTSTRILSNSRAALDFFHGPEWEKCSLYRVIPNGLNARLFTECTELQADARRELGIDIDAFVVGHVGRYDPAKNHKTIFAVAAEIVKLHPDVVFVFCGKGTDSTAFLAQLHRNGITNRYVSLGLQQDMPKVYRAYDLFYFPSVTEGQPNALIEAMVAGVPILAADIPGIKETVPPSLRGTLIAPRDVKTAVTRISEFIIDGRQDVNGTRQWALRHFDPARNFGMFLHELEFGSKDVSNG